jgi:hypothetical protein
MRLFGFRLPFFVAVVWVAIGSTVWALGQRANRVETVYVTTSATTLTIPTTYVPASSWVQPSAYVVPSYYATAYWVDPIAVVQPSYVSTAYIRRGLFGRQWLVERPLYASSGTTYLPTSYFVPTSYYRTSRYFPTVLTDSVVWPSGYLASADCVCPELVASAASPARSSSSGATIPRAGSGSKSIESKPVEEGAMNSDVEPVPSEPAPAATGAGANLGSGGVAPGNPQNAAVPTDTTPTVPAVTRDAAEQAKRPNETAATKSNQGPASPNQSGASSSLQGGTPRGQAGGTGGQTPDATAKGSQPGTSQAPAATQPSAITPPTAPDYSRPAVLPPPPAETNEPPGEVRRQSLRPPLPAGTIPPEFRNVLLGFVHSSASGQREEGVRVSITDPSDPMRVRKATMTDAFGKFAIRLTDGDWTVNVTMPSGRVYPVSQVRVSDGQITDTQGRRVPSLEITR